MKKITLALAALVLTTGVFAQTQKKADEVAKFKSEVIDLGKLKQDNPTTAVFEVVNISKEPLIIEAANPTCGCTIGDYTKEPIAPGKTGYIKATYNAKNLNMFEKHLTVKFAGIDEVKSITIKGEVLTDEDFSKLPVAETKKELPSKPMNEEQKRMMKAKAKKAAAAQKAD
jgi:hypothetical protein